MSSHEMFEARLERALREYGEQALLPFDPEAIAERAIGSERRPAWFRAVLVPALILALLVALAVGIATLTAPDPPPEPQPSSAAEVIGGELAAGAGEGHAAVRLHDGRLFVVRGSWNMGAPSSAGELWDPSTGTTTGTTSELTTSRMAATATLLANGRVLVVGGYGGLAYPNTAVATAELWDPATNEFVEIGSTVDARVGHSATLLPDGRVLVVGGAGPDGVLASAEVFDPEDGSFSRAGTLAEPRTGHSATVLADGRVLVVGGYVPDLSQPSASAELWDPAIEAFAMAGELLDPRADHTATLLADGRVLVVGGYVGPGYSLGATDGLRREILTAGPQVADGYLASAEIWDPATASFSSTGALREARGAHTATLLGDGRVAVIGGSTVRRETDGVFLFTLGSVEFWASDSETFSAGRELERPRSWHSAIPINANTVLLVGGGHGPDSLASVEVWEP